MALGREDAALLVQALGPEYEPGGVDPLQTLQRYGMLFTRDRGGPRVDFLLADTSFDREAVARARTVDLAVGIQAKV